MKPGEGLMKWHAKQKELKLKECGGRKGYPVEVLEGKVTKEKHKKDEAGDKVYLLGNKSALMLRKAINEGLAEKPELNMVAGDLYDLAEEAGWDKKKLQDAYKFLAKAQMTSVKELAVNASKFVIDKLIPDKVEPRKQEGEKSADDLRKSLLGLFKQIRPGNNAGSKQDDGVGSTRDAPASEQTTVTGIISVTRNTSTKKEGSPDRFLRGSGSSTRELPQMLKEPEVVVRGEQSSKDGNDNS